MVIKNLVRRLNYPVACDIYTCNNLAKYEVSHEATRAIGMQLCEDCFNTIVNEGTQLLAEDNKQIEDVGQEAEINDNGLDEVEPEETAKTADSDEIIEKPTVEEKNIETIYENGTTDSVTVSEEEEAEGKEEAKPEADTNPNEEVKVYTCKRCGEEFTNITEFRSHNIKCSRKAKAK